MWQIWFIPEFKRDLERKGWLEMMNAQELLEIVVKLLKTDADLDFLLKLSEDELKILVGCIRERIELVGNK